MPKIKVGGKTVNVPYMKKGGKMKGYNKGGKIRMPKMRRK